MSMQSHETRRYDHRVPCGEALPFFAKEETPSIPVSDRGCLGRGKKPGIQESPISVELQRYRFGVL